MLLHLRLIVLGLQVCVLMQDHPDLVEGFADFLPCPSLTTTSNNDPEQNIGVDRPDEEGDELSEVGFIMS